MRTSLMLAAVAATTIAATPLAAQMGGQRLSANLSGQVPMPGPGDRNGSGTASVRINLGQNRICYDLHVRRVQDVTAAHIHRGRAGIGGPVVVPLKAPVDGASSGCTRVSRPIINDISRNPGRFYVNVHNTEFPAGAIRGQLHR